MHAADPDIDAVAHARPVVFAGQQPASLIVHRELLRSEAVEGGTRAGRQRDRAARTRTGRPTGRTPDGSSRGSSPSGAGRLTRRPRAVAVPCATSHPRRRIFLETPLQRGGQKRHRRKRSIGEVGERRGIGRAERRPRFPPDRVLFRRHRLPSRKQIRELSPGELAEAEERRHVGMRTDLNQADPARRPDPDVTASRGSAAAAAGRTDRARTRARFRRGRGNRRSVRSRSAKPARTSA